MTDVQLRIKPTVVGSAAKALRGDATAIKRLDQEQQRALRRGVSGAKQLERAYTSVGRSMRAVGSMVGTVSRNLMGMKSIIVGTLAAGAGKTFIEATIGSADQINTSKKILGALLKDQTTVNKALKEARNLTQEVASISYGQALQGFEKTLVLAGNDVGKAKDLLKVAKALEAATPGQSFEDALFSLKELEEGSAMSLRSRFGIRLLSEKEAAKAAKKTNQTLADYYFDEVIGFIDKRYGDENERLSGTNFFLDLDRQSLSGQIRTVKNEIRSVLDDLGVEAQKVASTELPKIIEMVQKLKTDPTFIADMKELAKQLASMTRSAIELATKIPSMLKSLRSFVTENSGKLKLLGGALVANKLTGGALGGAAANLAGAAGRRVLFGRKGGGGGGNIAGALGGAAGGATPVFVVNMGMGGMGGMGAGIAGEVAEGFLARNAAKSVASKAATSTVVQTTWMLLKSKGLVGAAASLGAGGAAALVGIPAVIAGAALTFKSAMEGTQRALKAGDDRRAAERTRRDTRLQTNGESIKRSTEANVRSFRTGDFRKQIDQAWLEHDQGEKERLVHQAVAGVASRMRGQDKGERSKTLAALNEELTSLGVTASYHQKRGQLHFDPVKTDNKLLAARGQAIAPELASVPQTFNVTINYAGTGNPEDDVRRMQNTFEEMARKQSKVAP